jgi:hypothetical protein
MYCNHKQVGRTRVNKVRERQKNPPKGRIIHKDDGFVQLKPRGSLASYKANEKVIGQIKDHKMTGLDKLFKVQTELFKKGLTLSDYKNYVQDKINNDKYYYTFLSEENVTQLHNHYKSMCQKKDNKITMLHEDRKRSKRQKMLFKEKKNRIIKIQKQRLIDILLKELKKSTGNGLSRKVDFLTITSDNWNEMKYLLFTGGRYMESHDKGWTDIYSKLVSPNRGLMLGKITHDDLNKFILENDTL